MSKKKEGRKEGRKEGDPTTEGRKEWHNGRQEREVTQRKAGKRGIDTVEWLMVA